MFRSLVSALVSTVFGIFFLSLCSQDWALGYVLRALLIGTAICFALAATFIVMLLWDKRIDSIRAMAEFASSISGLSEAQMSVLGLQFPTIRWHMRGVQVRGEFENTGVPIEMFRMFMQGSNSKYVSPRRDWYTREKPEWAWIAIYNFLVENGKIIPDSAGGNVSYLWVGDSYEHMMLYLMAGRPIVDMSSPAYAATTDPLPYLKQAPEDV